MKHHLVSCQKILMRVKVSLWSWCQIRPLQLIELPAGEGSTFIRSVLEHGSEVLRSSSCCSKARSCKACLGFQWAALWAVAFGMGTKLFVSHWQCYWVRSLPAVVSTVFYFFSFSTGKNPIENTWSDTITAWAFKTMGMPQFPGELGRSYSAHKKFLVWLQTNQATRHPLHFSGGLGLEQSLLGNWNQIFFLRLRVPYSQNACFFGCNRMKVWKVQREEPAISGIPVLPCPCNFHCCNVAKSPLTSQ